MISKSWIDSEKGMRGRNRLAQALRYVTGKTASPFEAKASMLIGSSWQLGGLGLGQFENNKRIKLNDSAQQICGRKNAYGDLVWEETPRTPWLLSSVKVKWYTMSLDVPEPTMTGRSHSRAWERG